jgi:hypothetical protein
MSSNSIRPIFKLITGIAVSGATLVAMSPASLAGGYDDSHYKSYSTANTCSNCNDVTLPATSSNIHVAVPGATGTVKHATTKGTRTVVIEDTYEWQIVTKPVGVKSKVVEVKNSGTSVPCTTSCSY